MGRGRDTSPVYLGELVSWSVTVNNIPEFEGFDLKTEEYFASQHPAYPRDAVFAATTAKAIGLKSATLSGGRTPNPYGGDEIVDVSIRGTPIYNDFLQEMREIVTRGPGEGSVLAEHFSALAHLRGKPCSHIFEPVGDDNLMQCVACGVYLSGTSLSFETPNAS